MPSVGQAALQQQQYLNLLLQAQQQLLKYQQSPQHQLQQQYLQHPQLLQQPVMAKSQQTALSLLTAFGLPANGLFNLNKPTNSISNPSFPQQLQTPPQGSPLPNTQAVANLSTLGPPMSSLLTSSATQAAIPLYSTSPGITSITTTTTTAVTDSSGSILLPPPQRLVDNEPSISSGHQQPWQIGQAPIQLQQHWLNNQIYQQQLRSLLNSLGSSRPCQDQARTVPVLSSLASTSSSPPIPSAAPSNLPATSLAPSNSAVLSSSWSGQVSAPMTVMAGQLATTTTTSTTSTIATANVAISTTGNEAVGSGSVSTGASLASLCALADMLGAPSHPLPNEFASLTRNQTLIGTSSIAPGSSSVSQQTGMALLGQSAIPSLLAQHLLFSQDGHLVDHPQINSFLGTPFENLTYNAGTVVPASLAHIAGQTNATPVLSGPSISQSGPAIANFPSRTAGISHASSLGQVSILYALSLF
ncbi:unnamed protein product [Protopolystoma xenopodis]|uniref:Uncharacterized protein n=1 Tax=Protopolystoma xenopodis TaxID=117903 RepID=A0A3S5FDH5_9PLAT|nr:unnamed protein product [Protopolystoma xenopodis]